MSSGPIFLKRQPAEEAQALLAAIVASSYDAIISKTLDGIVSSWNAGAERLFGYSADEAVGRSITLIIPPELHAEEQSILERLRRGERVEHSDTVRVTKDGRLIHVSLAISPVRDRHGRIIGASKVARDITARKQMEEDLRRSAEAQRFLVSLHDAMRGLRDPAKVMWEIVTSLGTYFAVSRCTYGEIDPAEERFTVIRDSVDGARSVAGSGRLKDLGPEIIRELKAGRTLVISDVREDPRPNGAAAFAAFAGIETRSLVYVPLVKEERFVALLMLHDREPRAWSPFDVALLEQMAERTWFAVEGARAEAALRESRDVLSLAMRGGRMGAWARDVATGRVWWSRELEELFGLAPGGFDGNEDGFITFVHEDDRLLVTRAMETALATGEDYVVELRFRHASGEWRWMEGRGRAVYGADGQPIRLYGIGIDITQRRQTEEALRLADRRKDEFLATLAHELRNPLAPIRAAVETMRMNDTGESETQVARDIIDRQARQLTRLVDDLLDLARITQGKIQLRREPVELAAVVRNAVESADPLMKAFAHTLTVAVPQDAIHLDADPARLSQIILNLLNNAAKYTPEGGHIRLTAVREGREAVVSVRDNGIGIAAEHLPHVFEMFSQMAPALERSEGGLGIGLALVRGMVELHGGSIEAHSDGPGRGSELIVRLPVIEAPVPAPQQAGEDRQAPPRGAKLRILVVDDNRDAADSLTMLLELKGHDVHTAYDGLAAVEAAETSRPDVVLLDVGLPKMNGYEAARHIRQQPWGKPMTLVAVTGWGQEEDKRRAAEAGFDHHLTKPVDLAKVIALLHDAALEREP
jgi:PAS domain S-box-containing protein